MGFFVQYFKEMYKMSPPTTFFFLSGEVDDSGLKEEKI